MGAEFHSVEKCSLQSPEVYESEAFSREFLDRFKTHSNLASNFSRPFQDTELEGCSRSTVASLPVRIHSRQV